MTRTERDGMCVGDLMTRDPLTVRGGDTLRTVVERMAHGRIRHLPVVDDQGALVGLVTQRDVLAARPSRLLDPEGIRDAALLRDTPVSAVMVRQLVRARRDTPLGDAVNRMLDAKLGCLPVVDPDDRLVGIVTEADFLKLARVLLDAADGVTHPAFHAEGQSSEGPS
ncbi:MAG: CBS domain-containing protein [Deltaproteobacteria bacterium]|nr:MAG: CBS domain-containing protein [Deltaproteobacteria bacterium]